MQAPEMALDREVAGLTCRQVLAGLGDFLDGELSADAARQVEAHLAGCDNCARYGGSVGRAVTALRTLGQGRTPMPDGLMQRLHHSVQHTRQSAP